MKRTYCTIACTILTTLAMVVNAAAQVPAATDEHKLLKKEEGKWKATVKTYFGPTGPLEEPNVATGTETNRMIGDFWIVSDFSGNFGGMPFTGHGVFGYDASKKKHVGMWVDSFSPAPTKMVGSFDEATQTMTYETTGTGMDGKPQKGKNIVVYTSDDTRTMTMLMAMPGQDEMAKMMEISYERMK